LLDADQLEVAGGDAPRHQCDLFTDSVALIVYRTPARIGECGEKRLLVVQDGEFRRLELIGTPQCDAALAEVVRQSRRRRQRLDDEEDEMEDEDL
jgi:hypothetical protein